DVPLITEPQIPGDDLRPSRTSKDKVYELIISDLKSAVSLLPEKSTYTANNIGRASKGSALGMLAKVNLTLGNYDETILNCQAVEALGYQLNADYSDNFKPSSKNSQESLFEVQYAGKTS